MQEPVKHAAKPEFGIITKMLIFTAICLGFWLYAPYTVMLFPYLAPHGIAAHWVYFFLLLPYPVVLGLTFWFDAVLQKRNLPVAPKARFVGISVITTAVSYPIVFIIVSSYVQLAMESH